MGWNVQLPPAEWFDSNTPALASLLAQLEDTKVVAIDTETTGLNIARDLPLYFSLSWQDPAAQRDRRVCLHSDVLPYFKHLFDAPDRDWVLANAKYDAHILANAGLPLRGRLVDTQVMHALLYEEQPHGLKAMAAQLLNWRWNDFFDTFKLEQVTETIERFDLYGNRITDVVKRKETIGEMLRRIEVQDRATLVEYASNDAYGTLQVYRKLKSELEDAQTWSLYPEKYRTLWDLFDKIEVPFTRVLWTCERNGILVNAPYLQSLSGPMHAELKKLERDAARVTNDPNFNLASTQQLAHYCFDVLQLKPVSWTKGGKSGVKTASVDKTFLDAHDDVEIVALKKRHSQVSKLLGTYVEGLQEAMDPYGRIHTRFNQDVARCLPAGELVLTSRGYLPVEQVIVGDYVVTHTGKPRKVIECSVHAPTPIYRVRLANGLELRTTGHHQYRSVTRWLRADQLVLGDRIMVHSEPEQWKLIEGWAPFEVSSWGRVRNSATGKLRALQPKGKWGHLKVSLYRGGAQSRGEDKKDFSVHRLVLKAFGTGGTGEVRHLNGIAWDNTIGNLAFGTSHDNRQDALRHGTMSQRQAGRTKLSESDVEVIRNAAQAGQPPSCTPCLSWETAQAIRQEAIIRTPLKTLARKYGVSIQSIHNILKNKTWTREPVTDAVTADELAERYGVSAGTIRDIWAGRRWQDEDYIEGALAKFYESSVVDVYIEQDEVTYGLTVEEDHSHVTGGVVTHNTGRLSSADPNLQNIPRAENDEHHLRGAFIAPPGMELIVADYEALEMRLLAAAAMDKKMIQIFLDGKDIHMGNAEMVFGIPYADLKAAKKIDKEIKEGARPESDLSYLLPSRYTVSACLEARSHVKAIGFGLNYGMKEKKLARAIKRSVGEAKALIEQYMSTYPAVAAFYKTEIERTRETGYAFSVLGRRRYLPEIDGLGKEFETWRAERQAVNVVIQGSAADVAKMAMINCYEADLEKRYGCRMLLQVHDELVFECPQETTKEAMAEIKDWMEHPFETELAVPLTVSIGRGPDWLRAK